MQNRPRYVLPETILVACIGCTDLLTTIYLLAIGAAHEGNQYMAALFDMFGPWGFVIAKAIMLGAPLAIAEWAYPRNPTFVRNALRICIVLYSAAYAFQLYGQL